jgi:(p)ppGpp synthase/HD superfamily hydrolase
MADQTVFAKREAALRYWLQGRGYHDGLRALELMKLIHRGLRKDGCTPESDHQIEMALHASRLPGVRDMERLIVVILLHDTVEDYALTLLAIERLFDATVAEAVDCLTKKIPVFQDAVSTDLSHLTRDGSRLVVAIGGTKVGSADRDEDALFVRMGLNPLASLAKPIDRGNNQRTMGGVFGREKQLGYVDFTDERILPMMKLARRRFPDQEGAYELLKHLLTTQARLVRSWAAMLEAA